MILTGCAIHDEVEAGRITITDFDARHLEPNSYGFHLASDLISYKSAIVDADEYAGGERLVMEEKGVELEPGCFYLASTAEAMGSAHHAATLYARRSVSTMGLWIQFSAPLGHAGAVFPWTLEIMVAQPVRVFAGMRIGKIAFWTMQGSSLLYDGKYTGSASAVPSHLSLEHPRCEAGTR